MEDKIRGGRSRRMWKEGVGCVEDLVGKNKFRFQFKYGDMIEIISCSFLLVLAKEEVGRGVNETISNLQKRERVNC